jgi:tripartite ATP-independent transporter DctP family solute receptor
MSHSFTRRQLNAGLIASGITIISYRGARAADFTMRQYHNEPPVAPLHKRLSAMWAQVEKETNGRVHVQVYPETNGDPNPLQKVLSGELEFLTLAGNGLSALVPACDVQATPFSFKTPEQVYAAMDGDLGAYLRDELRGKGLYAVPFGCFENGMHQITTVSRPIRTAADFQGMKARIPGSKLYQDFFRGLGATIVTTNISRIHAGLKAGEIDAQDDPLNIVEFFKFYEFQKYASMTDHSWSGYNMLTNLKLWQSFPSDIQAVIEKNVRAYAKLQRADNDHENEELRQGLAHRGMVFNDVDKASFRPALTAFYPRWKEWVGTRAWDLMQNHTGKLG